MMETSVPPMPLASKEGFSGAINLTSTCVLGDSARSPRVLDKLPVYDLEDYLKASRKGNTWCIPVADLEVHAVLCSCLALGYLHFADISANGLSTAR